MSVLRPPADDAPPATHRTYRFAVVQLGTWQSHPGLAPLRDALT